MRKDNAILGQAVQVRRLDQWVTCKPVGVPALVVRDQEENVRAGLRIRQCPGVGGGSFGAQFLLETPNPGGRCGRYKAGQSQEITTRVHLENGFIQFGPQVRPS